MKKICMFLFFLALTSKIIAQKEVNIYSGYNEVEIKTFLQNQNYTVDKFMKGVPDSLEGAIVFTSFRKIANEPVSYSSTETAFFENKGMRLAGGLDKLSCSHIEYTVTGHKENNTPVILFLGSASFIFELSYSNVDTKQLEYFRIYLPSFLDNTLKEFGFFLANDFKLLIKKPVLEWASIPTGTFMMGASKKEKKRYLMPYSMFGNQEQHQEKVAGFEMSKYEITYDQYDAFCTATGRTLPNDGGFGRGNRPVMFVSYFDAVEFAEWMGCRLPTETEWEYACRAGTTTYYNTGEYLCCEKANVTAPLNDKESDVNCNYCSVHKTVPVGSYPPNQWGLFDMYGNVAEWTSSWFDNYITTTPLENGRKTVKGGTYGTVSIEATSAARDGYLIRDDKKNWVPNKFNGIGFRLARDK